MAWLSNSLVVCLLAIGTLYIAYRTYGQFLAERVLGFEARRQTPAVLYEDGMDYVPTHRVILFGHHFSSIAGLAPIVGPAIALFYGWLPGLLWVVLGCILIGGVHDMSTLFASLRHHGRGIGEFTNEIMGPRARALFLLIIFFLLALAMGVFVLLMATLFVDLSPQSVVPTFSLIAIAFVIGVLVYRRGWRIGRATLLGVALMFVTTFAGLHLPVPLYRAFVDGEQANEILVTDKSLPQVHGIHATRAALTAATLAARGEELAGAGQAAEAEAYRTAASEVRAASGQAKATWTYVLLAYAFAASVLPVWLLLQPRDYINSYQLYIGLGLMVLGVIVWHPQIVAPAIAKIPADAGAEPLWPMLFITIACGAVSGFHNLVSSGTTVRQIRCETDAHFIGYGAMLTEGTLAVLVILCCAAGLSREEWAANYANWRTASDGGLNAFLGGAGAMLVRPVLPFVGEANQAAAQSFARNFIAVVAVSFAMTTLDSATRLLRYNVEAIGELVRVPVLKNRYVASLVAVGAICYFALIKINGQPAGNTLWQLFGTSNQLLAGLGLLVVSVYLHQLRKPVVYTVLPMVGMFVSVGWAMTYKLGQFYAGWREHGDSGNASLFGVGLVILLMTVWMVVEAGLAFGRSAAVRRVSMVASPAQPLQEGGP